MAPIFDKPFAKGLNQPICLFLVSVFIPLLQFYLRRRFSLSEVDRLICRHSITNAGNYNFLYSDVDLSMILDASQLGKAHDLQAEVHRLRKVFLFLGELEIYSCKEHEKLELLSKDLGENLVFLRNLRKIGWIEDDMQILPSSYHQNKAKRAISKIFEKYGVSAEVGNSNNVRMLTLKTTDRLQAWVPSCPPSVAFKSFVNYLGFTVAQGQEKMESHERGLWLPDGLGLTLLALTPYSPKEPDLQNQIASLRQESTLRQIWLQLVEIEVITLTAVYRGNPDKFPWMPAWIEQLREMPAAKSRPIDIVI